MVAGDVIAAFQHAASLILLVDPGSDKGKGLFILLLAITEQKASAMSHKSQTIKNDLHSNHFLQEVPSSPSNLLT